MLSETHVLDLLTTTWSTVALVEGVSPTPRCFHSAWIDRDNRMIVFGGGIHAPS